MTETTIIKPEKELDATTRGNITYKLMELKLKKYCSRIATEDKGYESTKEYNKIEDRLTPEVEPEAEKECSVNSKRLQGIQAV